MHVIYITFAATDVVSKILTFLKPNYLKSNNGKIT